MMIAGTNSFLQAWTQVLLVLLLTMGMWRRKKKKELGPPQPKVKNLSEAISHLEGVQEYLDSRGHLTEATIISSAVALLHCTKSAESP